MSILFTLKGELDRRLYWIQMRQEALRFISGYRRNNIIDISFPEKLTGEVAKALCSTSSITMLAMTAETGEPLYQKFVDSRCHCMQIAWFWGKKTCTADK